MSGIHWNTADYLQILTPNDLRFIDGRIKTHGSGSPEGVLTAVLGSEYTDTATGSLYLKTSGSGNTGWSLIAVGSSTSVLPGTIIAHVSSSQSGYLLCDGTEVSRSTYSSLFGVMPNASATVTIALGSPCVVTWTSNVLTTGSQVQFSSTGVLPSGITADLPYFVGVVTPGSTFRLYGSLADAMSSNSPLDASGTPSGTITATTYFYGNGDGSTTFNLPNLQGLVPRGIGQTSGFTNNPTIGIGELTEDQFQAHIFQVSRYGVVGANSTASIALGGGNYQSTTQELTGFFADTILETGSNGTPRIGPETRGKSLGVYFLIKT
ncbi:hypothetical protein LPTSP3_g03540 [Leptospira kobayashii]|uniref:Phage tail collar domain protein n=1 Tax=Leptospira kobayashii TaxID=1917830 RepID=A0ABN6KAZ7_9LEPT|nr:hypothetical protein [Leptospira kobayashii]BDA77424.1 hypothetical protein LPTSP3_g03540 [Leptospira kobayashii]